MRNSIVNKNYKTLVYVKYIDIFISIWKWNVISLIIMYLHILVYMLYEYICSHFKIENRAFIAYVAFLSLNFYHLKMKGQLTLLEYNQ